jgi:DNA mismatch endonuclease, patch repair protein
LDGPEDKYGQPISADILAPSLKLIIEMDGCNWHYCHRHRKKFDFEEKRKSQLRDLRLTKFAESLGYTVIRVWEHDVLSKLDKVVSRIEKVRRRLVLERLAQRTLK